MHLGFEDMAIAPKNPRKRAAKKTPKVIGEVKPETTAETPVLDAVIAEPAEKKAKPAKKAAAVPVAIFQAAPVAEKAPAKKAPAKKSATAKSVIPAIVPPVIATEAALCEAIEPKASIAPLT